MGVLEEFVLIFAEFSLLFILVSILVSFVSLRYKNILERHLGSSSFLSHVKAFILGCLTPFCSCSSVPVLSAFLRVKIPLSVCLAFFLSAPLINPIIITMMILVLGWKFCIFYIVFLTPSILLISFLFSFIDEKKLLKEDITQFERQKQPCCNTANSHCSDGAPIFQTQNIFLKGGFKIPEGKLRFQPHSNPPKVSFKILFSQAFEDYKKLFVYLLLSAFIGAFLHDFIPQDFLVGLKDYEVFGIFIAAFVSIFLYIRAEMIIPLALVLSQSGVPQGIIISFLIAGAGCCLPSLILLKALFRLRMLLLFILIMLTISVGSGILISV